MSSGGAGPGGSAPRRPHGLLGGVRRFPPARERAFQAGRGAARSRSFVLTALAGVVIFDLYALLDAAFAPQVLGLSLALRLGVVTPVTLLVLVVRARRLARCPGSRAEGPLVALTAALQVACLGVVSAAGPPDLAGAYFLGAHVLVLLHVVLLRSDARHAALVAGTLLVAFAVAELAAADVDPVLSAASLVSVAVSGAFGVSMAVGLESSERAASTAREREAELVAEQSRLIAALASANAELAETARRDGLTGLLNRRGLDERLRAPGAAAHHLVMLDVDHFKAYNDRCGHEGGDECLRRVAAALRAALRPGDALARFGGEEFTALLHDGDAAGARASAERLRAAVRALQLPHPARPDGVGVVTVSVGVASGGTTATLLGRADAALYAAKSAGRDRVRVAP
ncbi:GGDEF domain-containing protein [Kineococcus gypseus]|uniref:GGDEF domain-containing protein n=1 Tax=Kineococcus gypseus TaxID=1637102 RepID=UPI003D7E3A7A